ncbi:roadblock/LC7 domain-containing protein [Acinetobacter sp. ME22]|uniref:roadblock/LC7 domain-containing protein n=1 Tax=Acinetobacter sp. ME22 TaxID=2904802 RepID=UPI001EDA16EE|nr:roadblock/LC7 domain-containing protein [Acinetobacter sp. ME22]MCG2574115.1 roadblock/LC7 domain-containing protein [Acinetobacter sp. ME22]
MLEQPKNQRMAPEELIKIAKAEAQDILVNTRGVNFIMICSTDGFALATLTKKENFNNSKIAAVSSSILAMISAFLHEINLTGCHSINLDAENGKAVLTSILAPNHPMLFVTLCNKDILLGQLLFSLKSASSTLIEADKKYSKR